MSNTETPIEEGQHRADPARKGRVVKVVGKPDDPYLSRYCWLIKTTTKGGRTSTINAENLTRWPIVEEPTP